MNKAYSSNLSQSQFGLIEPWVEGQRVYRWLKGLLGDECQIPRLVVKLKQVIEVVSCEYDCSYRFEQGHCFYDRNLTQKTR